MFAATCSVVAVDDVTVIVGVAATDSVVVVVGATAAIVVWVQRCLMRPCTSSQFHFVSVVVTLMGKESSWWYRKQPRAHIQQRRCWCVVNHTVDCRDDISVCGSPLWLNGGDGRDNVGRCR